MALRWEDVSLQDRTITISKALYGDTHPQVKKPKTEKGVRVLPILTKLAEKIVPGKGLVFPAEDGGYINTSRFQQSWERYQRESGVTCTPHQLRHAYATMLYENDVPESDAKILLGHAQISTTRDIYTHIRESKLKKMRSKILDIDIV